MAACRSIYLLLVLGTCLSCLVWSDSLRDEDEVVHNVALGKEGGTSRRNIEHAMRITLVYLDLRQVPSHVLLIKKLLNEAIEYFGTTLKVKQKVDKILLDRRCVNSSYFLKDHTGNSPGKVRFCKVACDDSKPLCGPSNVPATDLAACRVCGENGHDCRNETGSVSGPGNTNTDFVLYVSAVDDKCTKPKTIAFAAVCQQEAMIDRPVAGYLNICPKKINNMSIARNEKELLATFKHEIFHALGFSPSLYAFYRYPNGSAITPRDETGMPPFDHTKKTYQWSDKIIKKIERSDWMVRGGVVSHSVQVLVTPKVQLEARKHFNCSTLEGAELENQGGPGTEMAHWEKRLFENEGMTGAFTQNSVFSRLTLALMEDSGWYKASFDAAEPLQWGRNLGCLFAKNSCKAWMVQQIALKKKTYPFCRVFKNSKESAQMDCSTDRSSVAMCNLVQYRQDLPEEYQYFDSLPGVKDAASYGGSVDLADFCPYYQGFVWTKEDVEFRGSSCSTTSNKRAEDKNYALEIYGSKSKCFLQGQPWKKTKCRVQWKTTDWGSGCYQYSCEKGGLKVIINGYKYSCYHSGQVLMVKLQGSDEWVYEGSIICPACEDICYGSQVPCPAKRIPAPPNAQPNSKIQPAICLGVQLISSIIICLTACILAFFSV